MTEPTINIEVKDWLDEYMAEELDLSDAEKMVEACVKHKIHPLKMARLATIARWREEADPEFWPAPKPQLNTGGATFWSGYLSQQMATAKMPNGKERTVRRFVAPVPEDLEGEAPEGTEAIPADEPYLAEFSDQLGADRALDFLLKKVPGYIMGRMKIIGAVLGRKGILEAAEMLHNKIDEIVGVLIGEQ